MKVVVLTTSYPAPANRMAGNFVEASVEAVRGAGVDVDVVSPSSFPHFGVALGAGIAQNLRAAPWKLAMVPPFFAAFTVAARRAARGADLVHAHWIPSAVAARATGNTIGRIVDAQEVAYVVAFLASPKSAAITGDAIACGGGAPRAIHY